VQVDLIGAQNDLMAMGARRAFETIKNSAEREKWLALPFTGVDGLPKTGLAWVRSGQLAATVIVPTNAGQAMEMMAEAVQTGRAIPEKSFTAPESFPALDSLASMAPKLAPTV
jgi:ABC-type sugar transport system substrate-binding protein